VFEPLAGLLRLARDECGGCRRHEVVDGECIGRHATPRVQRQQIIARRVRLIGERARSGSTGSHRLRLPVCVERDERCRRRRAVAETHPVVVAVFRRQIAKDGAHDSAVLRRPEGRLAAAQRRSVERFAKTRHL
jgi:hypothetical protein